LNHFGYLTASYDGTGCSGCGICFYVCPEPGAVTVYAKMDDRARDSVNPIAPWRALALECG
jgi:MinD superfamily P-loop ATPase